MQPEDADFRYSLGKVYCDLRRYDDAIPQFEHALRIEPTYKRAQLSLMFVPRGLRNVRTIFPNYNMG